MHTSLLFASILAAQASAACTGAGCAIDDEVSLMQVKQQIQEGGVPASGAPASGAPASGAPASGAPASGAPASGVPASGVPASGQNPPSCDWDGTGDVPSEDFVCAKCPKVLQVAAAAGFELEVKRDPKALFTEAGQCHERATMTDPANPSATGMQYECVRQSDFSGPCTSDNQDACVCHLGTKGEGMTFKEMVAGFKKTVKQSMTKDEEKNGGDFSHSEEEAQICNWDGSGDVPDDKFVCSSCPKVKKILAAKGKMSGDGKATYKVVHPKSSETLYTADADCFESAEMVNADDPTEAPTNFQCRRSVLFTGDCNEDNEHQCSCGLGKKGDGATFEDLVRASR